MIRSGFAAVLAVAVIVGLGGAFIRADQIPTDGWPTYNGDY